MLMVVSLSSRRAVFAFFGWLDLLEVVLAFWVTVFGVLKSLLGCLLRVTDITSFEMQWESSSSHTLSFYPNLVTYRLKKMFLKESFTWSSTVI